MFTPAQAAAFLSVSVHTLAVWRRSKVQKGPRYFKRTQVVRYRREDLESFVARHMVDPERRAAR